MNINNHNYEMYLMLYADNELCIEEMKMVEDFVSNNPELKKEFELTLSSKISDEEISLDNKIDLFKFNGASLQESLLLHLDGENVANNIGLEKLIKSDSEINKEWNTLKASKLDNNDQIVFENKNSLYRHETRTVSFRYLKYAVAAVLIGLGLFFGIKIFTNNKVENNVPQFVNANKNLNNNSTQSVAESATNNIVKLEPTIEPDVDEVNKVEESDKHVVVNEMGEKGNSSLDNSKGKKRGGDIVDVIEFDEGSHNSNQLAFENNNSKVDNSMLQENLIKLNKISPEREVANLTANKIESLPVKNIAIAAVSKPTNTESIGHVFVIDEEKVNHSKAAGLFNKVKKFVNKTTNLELPDHVSVGNYEIAIK